MSAGQRQQLGALLSSAFEAVVRNMPTRQLHPISLLFSDRLEDWLSRMELVRGQNEACFRQNGKSSDQRQA